MDVQVLSSKKNPLLYREEFVVLISFDAATPKREEIRQAIVQKLGCSPDLMVVERTQNTTGKRELKAFVRVYESKEKMESIEPKHVLRRNGLLKEERQDEQKQEGGE